MSRRISRRNVTRLFGVLAAMALASMARGATHAAPASKISPAQAADHWQAARMNLAAAPDDERAPQ